MWSPVARCMPMATLGAATCIHHTPGKDLNIGSQAQQCLTTVVEQPRQGIWRGPKHHNIYLVMMLNTLLSSTTVFAERLCFHRCLSVHRGGVYPPGQTYIRQRPPGQIFPLGRHPWGRHPLLWTDNPL